MSDAAPKLVHVLTANAADDLKHFRKGAKLYLTLCRWGDGGESVTCLGYHKGSGGRRMTEIVLRSAHLENFRVTTTAHPRVVAFVEHYGERTREELTEWVGWMNRRREKALQRKFGAIMSPIYVAAEIAEALFPGQVDHDSFDVAAERTKP